MKLSEAIRIGCEKRPRQAFGRLYAGDDASCVWGAALDARGCESTHLPSDWDACINHLKVVDLPCGCGGPGSLTHLNDYHGWSRERIADWVEYQGY